MSMPLGAKAPDFALPAVDGTLISRDDFSGRPALLVMFICNHCPYVKHVRAELALLARNYTEHDDAERGVGIVGINANDARAYPEDAPGEMAAEVDRAGYTFPYLYDAEQTVAKDYGAACTPDFFLFDASFHLVYRGRLDGSRPNSDTPVTGADLRAALDSLLAGEPVSEDQQPSMGCGIKWKPGNEPD